MKRIISLFMAVVLLMSLTACGGKAERYCWNCGEGIAKSATFCSSCGVEQGGIGETTTITEQISVTTTVKRTTAKKTTVTKKTTSTTRKPTTTTKKLTTTQKPTTQKPTTTTQKPTTTTQKPTTTTQKPTTTTQAPVHTHSYSKEVIAPTCTQKGYTKYTCSCGHTYNDSYTNPSHSYSKYYICTECGIHDKEHTYEFLVEYVKRYGEPYATSVSYVLYEGETGDVSLTYNARDKYLYISVLTINDDGTSAYCSMTLDTYFYGYSQTFSSGDECQVYGYIDYKNYTDGAPLDDTEYEGLPSMQYRIIETARTGIAYLTTVLNAFAEKSGEMQLTMADMGFLSY